MSDNIKNRIKEIFQQSEITLSNDNLDKFTQFYYLFDKYNDKYDLSRIKNSDDIIIKHFVDSVFITKFCHLPKSLVDIGTGAGFPGLPLKIVSPETYFILAEPRHKRVKFMQMVIDELKLDNVEVYPHKVTEKSFLETEGVITRAFEEVNGTLERVKHFLPMNGKVIFMKGPKVDEDFEKISTDNSQDYKLLKDEPYILPGINHQRRLVIFEKITAERSFIYKMGVDNHIPGKVISSTENSKYKEFKKLTTPQGIKKLQKCLINGKKQISDIHSSFPGLSEYLLLFDDYNEKDMKFQELIEEFDKKERLFILKKSLFKELDSFKSNSPLLITKLPEIKNWDKELHKGCTLLIPFQDPTNVGSIIRTAVAFNIEQIILLKEAANPFNMKSIRTSGGTVFHANLFSGPSIDDIAKYCIDHNFPLITLDKNGEKITNFQFPDDFFLLPGLEGPGIPEKLKKYAVSIPINNKIESLNAAIATSIALFAAKSK